MAVGLAKDDPSRFIGAIWRSWRKWDLCTGAKGYLYRARLLLLSRDKGQVGQGGAGWAENKERVILEMRAFGTRFRRDAHKLGRTCGTRIWDCPCMRPLRAPRHSHPSNLK